MFVPLPPLILAGLIFLVLIVLAMSPRGRSKDLLSASRLAVPRGSDRAGRALDCWPMVR
jgi:hypothetical protein